MPTLAQKTRAFNDMVPEARRLGIYWAWPHTSCFAAHAGADRQIARLAKEVLASGGTLPEPNHGPVLKNDSWSAMAPELRAERAARVAEAARNRAKTPGELCRDQLNRERARNQTPETRRKLAEGVRASWTPERREAEREVGRQKWGRFGDRVIDGMLASWDSYTGRLANPKLRFDLNFTLEQLNAMTFEDADPFEGWVDDGLPIRTLNDRLDALHARLDAVLGVRTTPPALKIAA
jgi:hypothetical protein